ncbi:MAG: BON domain-containing protein [Planctomycetota bacterium]
MNHRKNRTVWQVFLLAAALTVTALHCGSASAQQTGTGENSGGAGNEAVGNLGDATDASRDAFEARVAEARGEDPNAANNANTRNQGRNTGLGALGGLFGGGGGLGGLGGFGNANQSTARPTIRTRLRASIAVPRAPTGMIITTVNQNLRRVGSLQPSSFASRSTRPTTNRPAASRFAGLNVVMDGRTARLSGNVTKPSDKRMAELLLRLEPGVSKVDNRIIVRDASAR